jgi:hypothetical protein
MREKMKTSKKGEKLNSQERALFVKGRCPDCGAPVLEGPHGGFSVNYLCASALCQAKFNDMGPFGVERLTNALAPSPTLTKAEEETPYRTPAERPQEPAQEPSLLFRLLYPLRWFRLVRRLLGGHWERFWDFPERCDCARGSPVGRWSPWRQLEECSGASAPLPPTGKRPEGFQCEDYTLRLFHRSPIGPNDSAETVLCRAVEHFDMKTPETSVFILAELQRLAWEGSITQREDAQRFLRWYHEKSHDKR